MTPKEEIAQIRAMLNSVASSVVYHDDRIEAHDRQIEALIAADARIDAQIEANSKAIAELIRAVERTEKATENLTREWQAYLRRLPPQ